MSKIEVIEVGPRDGFQSVKCAPPIATELKLKVIDKMAAAGVKHMEYTSFVSPRRSRSLQMQRQLQRLC